MTLRHTTLALAAALALSPLTLCAQDAPAPVSSTAPAKPAVERSAAQDERSGFVRPSAETVHTFYLQNTSQQNDVNEILVALRNILLPAVHIYLVTSQNAIIVSAAPDQIALVEKIIRDLDRPKTTYRLTYTVTELDSGKPIGNEHYSFIVVSGQRTTLKRGDKIPVATGTYSTDKAAAQTQFTYLDVGMNFAATLDEFANGVRLQSKVEQSSVGPSNTIAGVQEPVVRQAVLEGVALLTPGRPIMLGSVDVPNSTHHLDISVVLDKLK